MGRIFGLVVGALVVCLAGLLLAVYLGRDEDNIQADNLLAENFTKAVATAHDDTDGKVDLRDVARFDWDRVLLVAAGTSRDQISAKLGREWTIDPGYRWRPGASEWDAILRERGDSIRSRFLADPAGTGIDTGTPEGRKRLLEFWLTTEEEGFQVVPGPDAEALVAYLLALRKAEFPLPEAKE